MYDFLFKSSDILWNALTIATPSLTFKRTSQAYLVKISKTHNKNLISLLHLLINCMSAKSTQQILSLNNEYTLLIIGVWGSSSSCWFGLNLIPLPGVDLSTSEAVFLSKKNYKP